ncbi:HET-domain-containing protein, partial [Bimuria novae-zelandiae CBS 107.79]
WIGKCNKEHKQCVVERAIAKLKAITLIDVRNQRLIHYKPGLQYVALSYVWGRGVVIPKRKPGRPSDLPDNISRTVIHAMFVADKIGIPFLWADAVCINQHDAKEKKQQFPLMDYIYEQAFATIVSLGDNATVGLPGVDNGPSRYPQVAAEFGSLKLLSRCPKLESEIQNSKWSTRGWTYQEGLFSRRCIFFSQHQVYFHCNGMLCTE